MAEDYDVEVAELAAIAARDREAFSRWLARCEIPLRRSLRGFADVVDSEAIVQDTAIQVWERASTITPDGRPAFLLRWARTVALNRARTHARRAGRQAPFPHDRDFQDPHDTMVADPFLRVRLQRCFERLRPNPQRALRARLEDAGRRADRELAASIGMGFDAFRQNLTRGRQALIKCLRSFKIDVMEYIR